MILSLIYSSFLFGDNSNDKSIQAKSAVVFIYHHFGESKYPSTNITLKQFEYHLEYLNENNYNVWPLSKIAKHIIEKKSMPSKTVAITIDDAYISTYTNAYPRLKKFNYPFTVFVNTEPVDKKYKNFMTWDQMREMQKHGGEFANHSLSHDHLIPKKDETKEMFVARVKKEVIEGQRRLDEELGEIKKDKPMLFSYPYGEYNIQAASLIENLGYVGVAQASGPVGFSSDLREIPRFAMAEAYADPKGFKTKLNTLPLPIDSVEPKEHLLGKQNPPELRLKLSREIKNIECYLSSGEPLEVESISKTEIKVYSKKPLKPPRDRYTCTAWAKKGTFYWYSHMWIIEE